MTASTPPPASKQPTWRIALLGAAAMALAAGAVGAALFVLSRPPTQAAETASALERLTIGALTPEAAAGVAKTLTAAAFPPTGAASPDLDASARAAFTEAAAQLAQDPDPVIRAVLAGLAAPSAKAADARAALVRLAQADRPQAPALTRAAGALLVVHAAPQARQLLERANALTPQDVFVWRMLSTVWAQAGEAKESRAANAVARALAADAAGEPLAAASAYVEALGLTRRARGRAFVLGRLGDAAAQKDDFRAAAGRYRTAVDLYRSLGDTGGLSLEVSKLARAELALGRRAEACSALRAARVAGAAVTPAELAPACGTDAPPADNGR